jgi:serpin B
MKNSVNANNLVSHLPVLLFLLAAVTFFYPTRTDAATTEGSAVRAVNLIAPDLYGELAKTKGNSENLCFSPYSVSTAFAMTYAGASGDTANEMRKLLHYSDDIGDSNAVLMKGLTGSPESGEILVANSIWSQKDFRLLGSFTGFLREKYDVEITPVDFKKQTEQSRKRINDWVAARTKDRIKDILPPQSVGADSRLVLVNALYFKASWRDAFQERLTAEEDFFLTGGESEKAQMMRSVRRTGYFETDDFQVVKLPYARGTFSMTVVLPRDKNGLPSIEAKLDAGFLDVLRSKPEGRRVNLTLPKFKVESAFDLADALKRLGLKSPFDEKLADFSMMNGKRDLYINAASHKAFVEIGEKGTEAAAATAIGVARLTAAAPVDEEPVVFRADHPFLFLISDEPTGTILFLGRVAKP